MSVSDNPELRKKINDAFVKDDPETKKAVWEAIQGDPRATKGLEIASIALRELDQQVDAVAKMADDGHAGALKLMESAQRMIEDRGKIAEVLGGEDQNHNQNPIVKVAREIAEKIVRFVKRLTGQEEQEMASGPGMGM